MRAAVSGLVATARIGLARQRGSLPRSWPVSVRHQPVAAGAGLMARVLPGWGGAAAAAIYVNSESKFFSALICTKSPVLDGQIAQRTGRPAVVLFFQAIGGQSPGLPAGPGRRAARSTHQWNQNPGSDLHVCIHARFSAHRCPQAVHWLCGVPAHCACPRRARPRRAVEALTLPGSGRAGLAGRGRYIPACPCRRPARPERGGMYERRRRALAPGWHGHA